MKCPKCGYLGFQQVDRCRNCGYDFSLVAAPAPELSMRSGADADETLPDLALGNDTARTKPASDGTRLHRQDAHARTRAAKLSDRKRT